MLSVGNSDVIKINKYEVILQRKIFNIVIDA